MKLWLMIISLLVMFVLQATVFQVSPLNAIDPSLTLVMMLYIAFLRGARTAILLGAMVGLFQDVVYGSFIGLHTFSMAVTGYFAGIVFRLFLRRSVVIFLLVVLGATAFNEFLTYGITRLFVPTYFDMNSVVNYAIRTMIFNGVAALLLYSPSVRLLSRRRNRYGLHDD